MKVLQIFLSFENSANRLFLPISNAWSWSGKKLHWTTQYPGAHSPGQYLCSLQSLQRDCVTNETLPEITPHFFVFCNLSPFSPKRTARLIICIFPTITRNLRNMRFKLLWLVIKSVQFSWNMNMSLHLFVWSPEKGLWQTRFLTEHWTCICCVHLPLMQNLIRRNFYQIPPYAEH